MNLFRIHHHDRAFRNRLTCVSVQIGTVSGSDYADREGRVGMFVVTHTPTILHATSLQER